MPERPASRSSRLVIAFIAATVPFLPAVREFLSREVYLVVWISSIGLLTFAAYTAEAGALLHDMLGTRAATLVATAGSGALLLAVMTAGIARSPVIRRPDRNADAIARDVDAYVAGAGVDRPTIRMASTDVWPMAASVLLRLTKEERHPSAGGDLLGIAGEAFTPTPGHHTEFVFEHDAAAPDEAGGQTVARAGEVRVVVRN